MTAVAPRADPAAGPIPRMLVAYGALLVTSMVYGISVSFGLERAEAGAAAAARALRGMAVFEAIDTAIVAIALVLVKPSGALPAPRWPPLAVWILGAAGLAAALVANLVFHAVLRAVVGAPPQPDQIVALAGLSPLLLIVYCVQPAIVEELFFRRLVLDTLGEGMRPWAAVAVTSLMFGFAHIGVPLSIPVLALVGVPLAVARWASGGLLLPMAMHFLHNLVILVLNVP